MSALYLIEIELAVGLGAFALAYGAITFVLWRLSRGSERRLRERATEAARTASGGKTDPSSS
ncbi:hypothetical protein [Thalassobaculum sp.]|uniref:hypothetical protein n=1 Tax=Thalassobaculum sp. TaxID=2022740 RepID=UPI0032EBB30C